MKWLTGVLLSLALALPAHAQETIVVYFQKGFYPAEDKAVDELVEKFQKKTGVKVEISRYAPQEMIPKTVAALDSGSPPDMVYGDVFDFQVAGKWAFEGRLEDLSDILTPMKDRFLPNTLETTFMYNDKEKKRAYYAFPVKRQTMHIQYWKDMLADAGFKESDIPKTWKAYWDFWCGTVQEGYRKKTGKRVYSVGSPMGVDSSDAFYLVPHLHGRLQRQAGERRRQAARHRQGDARGPDQRGARLHRRRSARAARRPPPSTGRTRTTTSPSTTRRSS